MFEVGRVCVKLAGRDAGKKCVVVDVVDAHTVLIDGETRRRKCNTLHLEPTEKTIHITKGISTVDLAHHAKELGFVIAKKTGTRAHKKAAPYTPRVEKAHPVVAAKKEKAAAPAKKEASAEKKAPKAKKTE